MERLTSQKEADSQRRAYERRLGQGYPRNIPEERYLRLADYEDTGLEPEEMPTGLELAHIYAAMQLLKRYQALGTAEELTELVQAKDEDRLVVLHKGTTNGLIRKILKLCERANGTKARKGQEVEPLITWQLYNILCKEFGSDDLEAEAALKGDKQ